LPADFQFPFQMPAVDLWIPIQQDLQFTTMLPLRGGHYLSVIALLAPDSSLQKASTELAGIQANLIMQYPAENAGWGVRLAPLQREIVGDVQIELLVLLGAVALVLLIACANVANLLLTRAASRSREFAVRAALGAERKRIIRQLLTESLLRGSIGGATGSAATWWAVRIFTVLLPGDLPRIHAIRVDAPVLCFTLLLSLLVSVFFGLIPALHATTANLAEDLKESTRASSDGVKRRNLRAALIVTEVALAVALLSGAGLLLRSFQILQNVSPGFRAEGV
jgi:putative ABC transport system permease protein